MAFAVAVEIGLASNLDKAFVPWGFGRISKPQEDVRRSALRVGAGDPIATLGRTGRATAHHVHFEIRRNGSVYNPLYLLPNPRSVSQVEEGEETEE